MARWRRPYGYEGEHQLRYLVAALLSVVGLFPLCGFVLGDLPPSALVPVGLFVLTWEAALWRVFLIGVYISTFGIKVRTMFRTRTIPWHRFKNAWAGQATNRDAWALWITATAPEQDIETPIWRRGSKARHGNRVKLAPEDFAALHESLNREGRRAAA